MALRELIARFDIQIDGAEELKEADAAASKAADNMTALDVATVGVRHAMREGAKATKEQADQTDKLATETESVSAQFRDGAEALKHFTTGAIEVGQTAYAVADTFLALRSRAALLAKILFTLAVSIIGLGFVNVTRKAWDFVEGLTAAVDEIGKMSTALGINAEAMQRWGHLADNSGATTEDLRASFKSLATQLKQAEDGSEGVIKNFKELGLDAKELAKVPLEDAMIEVTAAIGAVDEQGKKLALTQALLSETAIKMLPGFKGSTEEMRAQLLAMDELAGVYSEEFIRAAEATNDELHFMRNQFGVLKAGIVMEFLPSFRGAVGWISKATASFRAFLKETDLVDRWLRVGTIAGLVRFSSLLAAQWPTIATWAGRFVRFISPLLRVIARFLFWALILDDIIVFLQGGESKLRDFLDAAFGIGTADKVLDAFRTTWQAVKEGIALASEVLGWLWDDFKGLLSDVANGTDTFDNAFGGFGGEIKKLIELAADLWGWLDRILGVSDAIAGIGQQIFEADDERMNREAIARAEDERKRAGGNVGRAKEQIKAQAAPAQARVASPTTNITDNSKVEVNLSGKQTPETVRTATQEARRIKSSRGTQNALIRGGR